MASYSFNFIFDSIRDFFNDLMGEEAPVKRKSPVKKKKRSSKKKLVIRRKRKNRKY